MSQDDSDQGGEQAESENGGIISKIKGIFKRN